MDAAGPAATAKTRKPCFSSSSAIPVAVDEGAVRPMTAVKAPLFRRRPPFESVAVASEVFFAGSNGTNVISLGRPGAGLCKQSDAVSH